MPDGYRRGGSVTRNGKTFQRRGTNIKPRAALLGLAGGLIAVTTLTGGSLIGSPILIGGVAAVVIGYVIHKNRKRLRPLGRKIQRKAAARYKKRNTRPALVVRAPQKRTQRLVTSEEVPGHPVTVVTERREEWKGIGMSGPSRQAPSIRVVTESEAGDGWKAGDQQCGEHFTGYAPGCATCRQIAFGLSA